MPGYGTYHCLDPLSAMRRILTVKNYEGNYPGSSRAACKPGMYMILQSLIGLIVS